MHTRVPGTDLYIATSQIYISEPDDPEREAFQVNIACSVMQNQILHPVINRNFVKRKLFHNLLEL